MLNYEYLALSFQLLAFSWKCELVGIIYGAVKTALPKIYYVVSVRTLSVML